MREYRRPSNLDEALRLLERKDFRTVLLAGGTHLVADSSLDAEMVIDLSALPLSFIKAGDTSLRIGALTRLQEIAGAPEAHAFAGGLLANLARRACTSVLRNQRTLAGAILTRSAGEGELTAALFALEANARICGPGGATAVALADLCGDGAGAIRGAILTEVMVRTPPPGARMGWERIARTPSDQAILAVISSCLLAGETIAVCRISIAGAGLPPRRLRELEGCLASCRADRVAVAAAVEALASSIELPDHRLAAGEYRRAMLPVLISRALIGGCAKH